MSSRKFLTAVFLIVFAIAGLAWGQPVPAANAGNAEGFIGTNVTLPVSFKNSGNAVGYGPYVDLVLPAADRELLDFDEASYLGSPLTVSGPHVVQPNGEVEHPYAVSASGEPVIVTGTPGERFYVIVLPFGSITQDQPAIDIDVSLAISKEAAPEQAITVDIASGFMYGTDALNNPGADPSILQTAASAATVTPKLMEVTKRLLAPEGDTAIGSNFRYDFAIDVAIAPGQTISALDITDTLPTSLVYLADSLSVTGTGVGTLPTYSAEFVGGCPSGTNVPVGPCAGTELVVDFDAPITADGPDVGVITVRFGFYLNVTDADGNQTGTDPGEQGLNEAEATGTWAGNKGAPGSQSVSDSSSVQLWVNNIDTDHEVNRNGTLRLQKWVDSGSGPAPFARTDSIERLPGQTVRFILEFQISDASAFAGVVITDPLPDGLEYVDGSVHFSYSRRGAVVATHTATDPSNWPNPLPGSDGVQMLVFDVSDLVGTTLLGSCVPDGGGALACGNHAGTTGYITYEAKVLDTYRNPAAPHQHVVQQDALVNTAEMTGDILWVNDLNPTGKKDTEAGTATVHIPQATASKGIVAINGVTPAGSRPSVAAGDAVTFSLRVNLGALSFHNLVLTDYLPLPVFEASTPTLHTGTCPSGGQPGVNEACFVASVAGATETWVPSDAGITVGTGSNVTANSVSFDFGSYTRTGNVSPVSFEIRYTVEVADTALTDGLFITNLLEVKDSNSDESIEAISNNLVQLRYTRPLLNISNGVIDVANNSHVTSPNITVTTPLESGTALDDLRRDSAGDYNLNVEDLDAGDTVTYLVIVENTGRGMHGAHELTLQEILPAGITPGDVSDLNFYRGTDGSAITGLPTDSIAQLFGTGLELPTAVTLGRGINDDATGTPVTGGSNILYYTYTVTLPDTVESFERLTTTSVVTGYSSHTGDASTRPDRNLAEDEEIEDKAWVTIRELGLHKSVVATSEAHTTTGGGGNERLAIGEIVRYQLQVDIPEGTTSNLVIKDQLPAGLSVADVANARMVFVDPTGGTPLSSSIVTSGVDTVTAIPAASILAGAQPTVTGTTGEISIDLGDIKNTASNDATESIVIQFNAVVLDSRPSNIRSRNKDNTFKTESGASNEATSNPVRVVIAEPNLSVTKTATHAATVQAGDPVSFTITVISHGGQNTTTAYELVLSDQLPVDYITVTAASVSASNHPDLTVGTDVRPLIDANGLLTLPVTSIEPEQSFAVTIDATVLATVPVGTSIANEAEIEATSLPGGGTSGNQTGATTPADGERTYQDDSTADVPVQAIQPSKEVISTSEGHTGTGQDDVDEVAIGEIVRYRLAAVLPAGTTNDLTFTDTLPDGLGLLDVAAANVKGALVGKFDTSPASFGTPIPGSGDLCDSSWPLASQMTDLSSGVTFNGKTATFAIGDMTVPADSGLTCVIVEFNVVVLNTDNGGELAAGDTARNSLNVTAESHAPAAVSATVRAVEPSLQVTKDVNPEADGSDAGDEITYTIEIRHTDASTADAFDLRIQDTVTDRLENVTFSLDHFAAGATTGTAVSEGSGTGNAVDIQVLDPLRLGERLVLTITGNLTVAVEPNESILNEVAVSWNTLPGTGTPSNPTGSVTPGQTGDGNGERSYSTEADVSFTTETVTLDKSIIATSEAHTAESATGTRPVVIGEIVRYRVVVDVPEGTTSDLVIVDALPAGLSMNGVANVRAAFLAPGGGTPLSSPELAGAQTFTELPATSILSGPQPTVDGTTGSISIDLGTIRNEADDASTEAVIVEYNVFVQDVSENARDGVLTNSAHAEWAGPNSSNTDSASVVILEPQLLIDKQLISPGGGLDAHDTLNFRITVTHAPGSVVDAMDVVVGETFPQNSNINTGAISVTVDGIPRDILSVSGTPGRLAVSFGHLAPNETAEVTFQMQLGEATPTNVTFTNWADVEWTSLPGTGTDGNPTGEVSPPGADRDYGPVDDSETITTDDLRIVKSVIATSEAFTTGDSVAIGEVVRYRLQLELPEGDAWKSVITDTLPDGMEFMPDADLQLRVAAVSSHVGAGTRVSIGGTEPVVGGEVPAPGQEVTRYPTIPAELLDSSYQTLDPSTFPGTAVDVSGQTIEIDLGVITNRVPDNSFDPVPSYLLLEFNAVVVNSATGTLSNTASVSSGTDANDPSVIQSNTVDLTVVQPDLSIAKQVTAAPGHATLDAGGLPSDFARNLDYGDEVEFTVTIKNDSAATAAARQIVLEDLIPAAYDLKSYSYILPDGTPVTPAVPATGNINVGIEALAPDETLTVTYVVAMKDYGTTDAPAANSDVTNTAAVGYTTISHPDDSDSDNPIGLQSTRDAPGSLTDTAITAITEIEPELEVTKGLTTAQPTPTGTIPYRYAFGFDIAVKNLVDFDVTNLSITEDLTAVLTPNAWFNFGTMTVTVTGVEHLDALGAPLASQPAFIDVVNPDFDGVDDLEILLDDAPVTLGPDESLVVTFMIDVTVQSPDAIYELNATDPALSGPLFENIAHAYGTTPGGIPPAPDQPVPSNPVEFQFDDPSGLQVTKEIIERDPLTGLIDDAVSNMDGSFDITLLLTVENTGIWPLGQVQVQENLAAVYGDWVAPADQVFTVNDVSLVPGTTTPTLVLNPGFTGRPGGSIDLLDATNSTLAPDAEFTIEILLTVWPPNTKETYTNVVNAAAETSVGLQLTDSDSVPHIFEAEPQITVSTCVNYPPLPAGTLAGTYLVDLQVTVSNTGNIQLEDVSALLDLDAVLGSWSVYEMTGVSASVPAALGTFGPATSDWELFAPGFTLNSVGQAIGTDSVTFDIELEVTPVSAMSGAYQVAAEGQSPVWDALDPNEGLVSALSYTYCDPTDPTTPADTPIELSGTPVIQLTKAMTNLAIDTANAGAFLVDFEFEVTNTGDVPLINVTLDDDLDALAAFGDAASVSAYEIVSITADAPLLAALPADAESNSNLLAAGSELGTAAQAALPAPDNLPSAATVTMQVRVWPLDLTRSYENTAVARGARVDEPTVIVDHDASAEFMFEQPAIGLAKRVVPDTAANPNPRSMGDGSYEVTYEFTIENLGDVALSNLVLTDDFVTQLNAGNPGDFTVTDGTLRGRIGYDGQAASNILDDGQSLAVGATGNVFVTVTLTPGNALQDVNGLTLNNQAQVQGTSPAKQVLTDQSVNGTDPDPDDDGDATDDNSPTPVTLTEVRGIALAKQVASTVTSNPDGTFDVTYGFTVRNTGLVDIYGVQITDDFKNTFDTAVVQILSITPESGSTLVAASDLALATSSGNLLDASSILDVGVTTTVDVTVRVTPGGLIYEPVTGLPTIFNNVATVTGTTPSESPVEDDSNNGDTPVEDSSSQTPVQLVEAPGIALAKDLVSVAVVGDGTFTVTMLFTLENTGNVDLSAVTLEDDLGLTFGGAAYAYQTITADGALLPATPAAAQADGQLLAAGSSLAFGTTSTVTVVVDVTPGTLIYDGNGAPMTFQNTATAGGTSPGERYVDDVSNDGTDPDPDDSTKTPIQLIENPEVAIAKALVGTPANLANGTYVVDFRFEVENTGNVNLTGISLLDDLTAAFLGSTVNITDITATAPLTAATLANANQSGELLDPLSSTLAVGQTATVDLRVEVTPGDRIYQTDGTPTEFENRALIRGTSPGGHVEDDPSNVGDDPQNGVNTPTPVFLLENPVLAVAKDLDGVTNVTTGVYRIGFTFTLTNVGDVNLDNVQLNDDLMDAFRGSAVVIQSLTATAPLTANADLADVSTGGNLLDAANSTLDVGQTATVNLVVDITPEDRIYDGPFLNEADGYGTSPGERIVPDPSNNGDTPVPGEGSPTPVVILENPVIGVAKSAEVTALSDGRYDVLFTFTVRNYGSALQNAVEIRNVQLTDNLDDAFGAGNYRVQSIYSPTLSTNTAAPDPANPSAYDGSSNLNLLSGTDTLDVGETAIVQLRVIVTPPGPGDYTNLATVTGTSPGDVPVTDTSTNGEDPDPNDDGTPDEEDPTPVRFDENPLIGLAKSATVTANADGSFNVTLLFTLRNMGDVPLRNVQVSDPLDGIYAITDLTPDRITVNSSVLTYNPDYDGQSDANILAGTDTMPIGAERTVSVTLSNIRPTSGTSTTNTALATGESPMGTPTEDRSTDGLEPDPNEDGTPDEDVPTPIELERITRIALAKSGALSIASDGTTLTLEFTFTVANAGNTPLYGIQVSDPLTEYYSNTNLTAGMISVTSGDFTVNPAFDGVTDDQLLTGADSLALGASGTVTVTLTGFTANAGVTELANSALADARGPDGTPTDDPSNDGTVPEPGTDVPTITPLTENPLLGVAKQAGVLQEADGSYTISFSFVVRNYGNVTLNNLSLTDDLSAFSAAGITGSSVSSTDFTVNAGFNGTSDTELLAPGNSLAPGESGTLTLVLSGVNGPGSFTNQASGRGESPSGTPTPPERSTDGPDPDPNGDGTPDEEVPTPVELVADPLLGVAKSASVVQNADLTYSVTFDILLSNMGNTHLSNVQVTDDLTDFYAGTDLTASSINVSSTDLTVNPGFDGAADQKLLSGTDSLAPGAEATVSITLNPLTPTSATRFSNSALGEGTPPGGPPVTDRSTDGPDPDPNGDGTPDEDVPTPVVLEATPVIGVAKSATVTANDDGSFDLLFDFVVTNYGNTVLQSVQVRDDLSVFYGPTDISAGHITVTSPDFTPNTSFDGRTDLNLLSGTDTLALGATGTITLDISGLRISEQVNTFNTAIASGTDPSGRPTPPDPSHDGSDPDPDGDGDPTNNNEPTPVRIGERPLIGLAKSASSVNNDDSSYDITYTLTIQNYGQVPLFDLSLSDPLDRIYADTNLTAAQVSVSSPTLTVNPGYDGAADTQLLAAGNSLGIGASATVTITLVDVVPNEGVTRVENSAIVTGTGPDGNSTSDTSTDGDDPDPDGSGPGNHNTPTVVEFEGMLAMLLAKSADPGPYGIGERVTYTITITNPNNVATAVELNDQLPPATTYVDGTVAFDPAASSPAGGAEPRQDTPGVLTWRALVLPAGESVTVTYELLLQPGATSPLINTASINGTGVSATATASVEVDQGVFDLDTSMLIGRVYLDVNRNSDFDQGVDVPLEGARVVLANGWQTLTDAQGNYAFRDLASGTWTVMVDQLTTPYNPAHHPEQLRDPRQHRVQVQGLTVSDFPFEELTGLAGARRETFVNFGPISLHKYQVPLGDTVRVVLDISSADPWPDLLVTDPVPGAEPREFVVELTGEPVVITYDLPAGTELTDPDIEWSNR